LQPLKKKQKISKKGTEEEKEEWPEEFNAKLNKVLDLIRNKRPLTIKEHEAAAFVEKIIEEMQRAQKQDLELYAANKPALTKLAMLKRVVAVMGKYQFAVHFVAFGGCKACASWLKPLPDGTRPNQHLRTEILRMVGRLPITKEALMGCGRKYSLGKVIHGIQNDTEETVENRKLASMLVQQWLRFVLVQPEGEQEEQEPRRIRPPPETAESLAAREAESAKRIHPAIPIIEGRDYVVRPIPKDMPVKRDRVGADTNRGKLGEILKIMSRPNKRAWKPYDISIAGRQVNAI